MRILHTFALFMVFALSALFFPDASFAQTALPSIRDCSIASLSGSSQTLLSAGNFQRKYVLVCNTGNATIGLNYAGGTAVIAGASQNLVAGACKEFSAAPGVDPLPPAGIITVIGTSGQPVACFEGK